MKMNRKWVTPLSIRRVLALAAAALVLMLTLSTSAGPAPSDVLTAAAFYQEQLAAAGWESDDAPMIDERLALLEFVQGSQRLYLRIDPGEAATTVHIIILQDNA